MAKTAILIDDDQDDLDILVELIAAKYPAIQCLTFKRPLEAMRVMLQDLILIPDFVFTDINMPELGGDSLISELRRNNDFDEVTIVVLSTSMPETGAARMRQLGANHAFEKPTAVTDYDTILDTVFSTSYLVKAQKP